jgi:dGTPase
MATKQSYDERYDFARFGAHGSAAKIRVPFEVDKGRVIHSAAFRRLQGKTQVLGVGERDFYRTRLTHSIEVAQLGRGLCNELEGEFHPDRDLVEAICLAHDIGHPPFGHSGEEFLHDKMKGKAGGFGANPQNLRIVHLLETKFLDSGLDLTRAVLDGLVKYPKIYDPNCDTGSQFTYNDDIKLLAWIKKGIKDPLALPIEAQLADWADQIIYSVNDIEDITRAGLLSFVEMRTRAKDISEEAEKSLGNGNRSRDSISKSQATIIKADAVKRLARELESGYAMPGDLRIRKANLKKWTSNTIKLLKKGKIVSRKNNEVSVRYRYALEVDPDAKALAAVLKSTAKLLVFRNPRVKTLEAKGRHIINTLFDKFREDIRLLPLDFQQLINGKEFGSKERLVADFIAGMTDSYAYGYYKRLMHPGIGSFYEDV